MKKYFILIISILFTFCTNDDDFENKSITSIEISTGEIYPAFNSEINDYYVTSLNTLNNIQITIPDFKTNQVIYINNQRVVNKTTSIHLNPYQDIIIENGMGENKKTYTIHYLPNDLPKINLISKNNPSDGYTFINLFELSAFGLKDFCYIAIIDNDGFPVFYKRLPYNGVIDFKCHQNLLGEKRFSYGIRETGKIIILNDQFETIDELEAINTSNYTNLINDDHDFIYINDNHYLVCAQYTRENVDMTSYGGSNNVDLVECVIQEIQDNEVIFEWDTANFPELLSATDPIYYSQYATQEKVDYFHFNSLAIDPNDNNLIISARHTNQVYKIDRNTGNIIWRFGGNSNNFNLNGAESISHQHCASILNNGNLLLFDNGVTKLPQQTRIAEFHINENDLTSSLEFEYKDLGRYFDIMGSVQKLYNGNYFIGWGGHITSQTNAIKSDITEINANGDIVLDISFSNDGGYFTYSYRALKYNITF